MSKRIGVLSFAHMHAGAYAHALSTRTDTVFAGIWDDDKARGRAKAEQYNTKFFDNPQYLINECDAVIVTSENVKHIDLVMAALNSKKPTLCEKPLMTKISDGQQMFSAAKENNTKLWTAFPCRFSPSAFRMKQVVEGSELGELYALRGTNRGQNPGGWFIQPALSGGGAMIDHTVHVTDLMRWMLKREVVSVFAETHNGMYHSDYDDTAFLTLEFENGVFATLDSSWSRPKKSFYTWGDVTLAAVGSSGVVEMDMFAQNVTYFSEDSGRAAYSHWGTNIDAQMVQAFIDNLEGRDTELAKMLADGNDGFRAAQVALAAYKSAREHQVVRI